MNHRTPHQHSPERRHDPRLPFSLPVSTDAIAGDSESLVNVSNRGCCIASTLHYESGEIVIIQFKTSQDPFCMPGRICWHARNSHVGNTIYGVEYFDSANTFFLNQRQLYTELLHSRQAS